MSEEKYLCNIEFTKESIVYDFIRVSGSWFDDKNNSFYGKRKKCLDYLMYWVENGIFGPDWDEHFLIYLENKFIEYFENCFELIQP